MYSPVAEIASIAVADSLLAGMPRYVLLLQRRVITIWSLPMPIWKPVSSIFQMFSGQMPFFEIAN